MKNKLILFGAFILVSIGRSLAQENFFKTFAIEEDNPGLKINKLFRDHLGYIWLGTSDGLYRYNGIQVSKIGLPAVASQIVTAIGEDNKNNLWIGLSIGSVFSISGHQVTPFKPTGGIPKKAINSFHSDEKDRIWIATGDEGLFYGKTDNFNKITTDQGLSDNYVYCLAKDSGLLLAGTDRGISIIQLDDPEKNIQTLSSRDGLPDNIVRVITRSAIRDGYWIGTQDKGIAFVDLKGKKIISNSIVKDWQFGQVNDILEFGDQLWIGTEDKGLIEMNIQSDGSLSFLKQEMEWPKITSFVKDAESNIWIAAKGDLVKNTGAVWNFLDRVENTRLRKVHAILCDSSNELWFTPDQGLAKLNLNNGIVSGLQTFQLTPAEKHIDITALYQDKYGKIWVGTMGAGAFRMDPATGKWRNIDENNLIKDGHILSITGSGDDIWISSLNGVAHGDLSASGDNINTSISFNNFTSVEGIGSGYVYNIFVDSKNRVWFATDGAGATVREKGKYKRFGEKDGLKSNVVYTISEDIYGNIWMATLNSGLYKYDGYSLTNYSVPEGLSDQAISSCKATRTGKLVIVTKKGIDILDCKTGKFINFGRESGIHPAQSSLNSITSDSKGNIWIGTDDGIIQYKSNEILNQQGPRTLIDNVALFLKGIDTSAAHLFRYSENNLTFSFIGLFYSDPEKVKYQYQLEGYNKEWIATSDQSINFPKLPYGKYTFRVRSSGNDEFDNTSEASFAFEISSPFWLSWWFIAGSIGTIIFIVYLFIRARDKRLRRLARLQKEKIEFQFETLKSQVNPHFLFNSFNTLINMIDEDPHLAAEYVQQLSGFYRNMLSYRSKDLITLDEELKLLETYIFLQQKRFGKALKFNVEVPAATACQSYLPPLTLQLLAENAVKHNSISKETPLTFEILAKDGRLTVKNNINPKLQPEKGEGVGLQNIAHRYRLLTNQRVKYYVVKNEFIVTLPLMKEQ